MQVHVNSFRQRMVPVENQKEKMENPKEKPLPPPLPSNLAGWMERRIQNDRTLNDYVEEVHKQLLGNKDPETRARYNAYLYATYDEQAVEGSLSADNTLSAKMIREAAAEDNPIKREKLATISKALVVVLRRYHLSRKERRLKIGDEIISDNGGSNVD